MMLLIVSRKQVKFRDGKLVADKSTLGVYTNDWPKYISVLSDKHKGHLFQRRDEIPSLNGKVGGYNYYNENDVKLTVLDNLKEEMKDETKI